jgi:hypothetical protein
VTDLAELTQHLRLRPIAGRFVPLTAEELTELEASLGTPLPSDYRVFLEAYGRTGFDGNASFVTPDGGPLEILELFGGPQPGRADDLFWQLDTNRDELPPHQLAIGDDSFGNRSSSMRGPARSCSSTTGQASRRRDSWPSASATSCAGCRSIATRDDQRRETAARLTLRGDDGTSWRAM